MRDCIGGWKLINFLTISYKLVAKALALRICSVAKYVVRPKWTRFVQGSGQPRRKCSGPER